MKSLELKPGDRVTVKGNDYGSFQFHAHLPIGSHGRRARLCEVIHDAMSPPSFTFGLKKTFRLSDVKLALAHAKEKGAGR